MLPQIPRGSPRLAELFVRVALPGPISPSITSGAGGVASAAHQYGWIVQTRGKSPPGRMKPRRQPGGHAPSAQQAFSARSGGGLAAAWARGVEAGAPGKSGQLSQSLRNVGAGQD